MGELTRRRRRLLKALIAHAGTYVVVNGFLVILWLLTGSGYPWFLWPITGWGVFLALHGTYTAVLVLGTSGEKAEDRVVEEKVDDTWGFEQKIDRRSVTPLAIKMLGTFEVTKGIEKFSAEDWKSKKSLGALKYLAANRDRGLIPRDVLIELLWPDSNPEYSSKNLNTTLSTLRKSLEPKAGRGESSYLITSGDSVRLELGDGGWIDFELFREKIKEAEKAKEQGDRDSYFKNLGEAEGMYTGDFLAEDLFEDWCRPERDRLKEEYLGLLIDISDEHVRRGDTEDALRYLEKATEVSPGREELYRGQMEIHRQMGNRAGIEQTFERCRDYLRDNFDVAPSPETVELYKNLRET